MEKAKQRPVLCTWWEKFQARCRLDHVETVKGLHFKRCTFTVNHRKKTLLVLRPEESAAWFLLFFSISVYFRDIWRMVYRVQLCMTLTNDLDTETWPLVVTESCQFYHVHFRCISQYMCHQTFEWLKPWSMEGFHLLLQSLPATPLCVKFD